MKRFNLRPTETGDQFAGRISRHLTDTIIDQIENISSLSFIQIKSILNQLSEEAL